MVQSTKLTALVAAVVNAFNDTWVHIDDVRRVLREIDLTEDAFCVFEPAAKPGQSRCLASTLLGELCQCALNVQQRDDGQLSLPFHTDSTGTVGTVTTNTTTKGGAR